MLKRLLTWLLGIGAARRRGVWSVWLRYPDGSGEYLGKVEGPKGQAEHYGFEILVWRSLKLGRVVDAKVEVEERGP